jgi:hypothetical protein
LRKQFSESRFPIVFFLYCNILTVLGLHGLIGGDNDDALDPGPRGSSGANNGGDEAENKDGSSGGDDEGRMRMAAGAPPSPPYSTPAREFISQDVRNIFIDAVGQGRNTRKQEVGQKHEAHSKLR